MPEQSMEAEVKQNTSEKIAAIEADLYAKVESGDPSVAHLTLVKTSFEESYDKGTLPFGTLTENIQKLKEVRGKFDSDPAAASQALSLMEAIHTQAELGDGKKYEVVVPADTPPEQKVAKGKDILRQDVDNLKGELAKKYLEQAIKAEALFAAKAAEAKGRIVDAKSRSEVRRTVYDLSELKADALYEESHGARVVGGRKAYESVKAANADRFKYERIGPTVLTDDESAAHQKTSREGVLKSITGVSEEVKKRIAADHPSFKRIDDIERRIESNNTNLLGKDPVVKDGVVEQPAKVGAYIANPEIASDLDDRNRRLNVDKKAEVGKVRLELANERVKLADEKMKEAALKLQRGASLKSIIAPLAERWVGSVANKLGENVRAQVVPQIDQLKDKIDVVKDDLSDTFKPVADLTKSISQGISGAVDRLRKFQADPDSVLDPIADSKVVRNVKGAIAGLEGQRRADFTEARKQIQDGVYAAEIAFKDGLKKLTFDIKMSVGSLIGGEQARQNAERNLKRLEALRSTAEQSADRVKSKVEANPMNQIFVKDLEKRFKTAEAPTTTATTPEAAREAGNGPFTRPDMDFYEVRRVTSQDGRVDIQAVWGDKKNRVHVESIDANGKPVEGGMHMVQENASQKDALEFVDKINGIKKKNTEEEKGKLETGLVFVLDLKTGKPVLTSLDVAPAPMVHTPKVESAPTPNPAVEAAKPKVEAAKPIQKMDMKTFNDEHPNIDKDEKNKNRTVLFAVTLPDNSKAYANVWFDKDGGGHTELLNENGSIKQKLEGEDWNRKLQPGDRDRFVSDMISQLMTTSTIKGDVESGYNLQRLKKEDPNGNLLKIVKKSESQASAPAKESGKVAKPEDEDTTITELQKGLSETREAVLKRSQELITSRQKPSQADDEAYLGMLDTWQTKLFAMNEFLSNKLPAVDRPDLAKNGDYEYYKSVSKRMERLTLEIKEAEKQAKENPRKLRELLTTYDQVLATRGQQYDKLRKVTKV